MGQDRETRRQWDAGPDGEPGADDWLALSDDDLLARVESLPERHEADKHLLAVVCSARHFFVRQEAAKRILDGDLLKEHAHDRHIGQILVRAMNRHDDLAYLERLVRETRHLEVRKAAEVQLERLRARFTPQPE
jgi:hypothetical protein